MRAYLLVAVGIALLVLAAAKVVGLIYLLTTGGDKPEGFFAKQAVYAVAYLALGVSAIRARRDRHVPE